MFNYFRLILVTLLLCCAFNMKAQHFYAFKGKVISDKGNPISFCHIILKNDTQKGVLSDYDGSFIIDVMKNDTLLIKYLGYKDKTFIIDGLNNGLITIEQDVINLQEFTITYSKEKLTAKKIVKKTINFWENNHLTYKPETIYKTNVDVDISVTKERKNIYQFIGEINLYVKEKRIYTNKSYHKLKKQNIVFSEKILNLPGATPYSYVPNLYFKLQTDTKVNFELGEITNYQNKEVYHIKYYRKKANGVCAYGGHMLINKNDFHLIYFEAITKKCVGLNYEQEQLEWSYAIIKTFFNNKIDNYYYVSKVESEVKYFYTKEGKRNFYLNKSFIKINNTSILKKINLSDLIFAKDLFLGTN